uniref:Uncharacterized protein n=1 Tax=Cannabis sativa TaxID=3483 RepID=A0A803QRB6_CANSA
CGSGPNLGHKFRSGAESGLGSLSRFHGPSLGLSSGALVPVSIPNPCLSPMSQIGS